jgi:diacylglycerol O-acyltransferase
VPIVHGIRVSTAILSYDERLYFGITGDAATAPDVDVLARGTSHAVDLLRDRARVRLDGPEPQTIRSEVGA